MTTKPKPTSPAETAAEDHPALAPDPRANASDVSNRIDLNDPTLPGHEAVAKALADQQD